jgi:hypothetical protein
MSVSTAWMISAWEARDQGRNGYWWLRDDLPTCGQLLGGTLHSTELMREH